MSCSAMIITLTTWIMTDVNPCNELKRFSPLAKAHSDSVETASD